MLQRTATSAMQRVMLIQQQIVTVAIRAITITQQIQIMPAHNFQQIATNATVQTAGLRRSLIMTADSFRFIPGNMRASGTCAVIAIQIRQTFLYSPVLIVMNIISPIWTMIIREYRVMFTQAANVLLAIPPEAKKAPLIIQHQVFH